jgi:hypothetical protein
MEPTVTVDPRDISDCSVRMASTSRHDRLHGVTRFEGEPTVWQFSIARLVIATASCTEPSAADVTDWSNAEDPHTSVDLISGNSSHS